MKHTVRKAVIPAAGLGTRFLPATKASPKEMLPLVDKPTIQYVVEEAVRAGLHDILVITGRGKRAIEDHFDRSFELEVELERAGKHDAVKQMRAIADMADIHYVRQGEARGLGHAIAAAAPHVGDEPFAVLLGDDVMDESSRVLEDMLDLHARTRSSVVAVKDVPRAEISSYGCVVAELGDDGLSRVTALVEKPRPDEAPSTLAVMGRYVLTPAIFGTLARVAPGRNDEIQLTDAIAMLLDDEPVHAHVFDTGRYDMGSKIDFLRATVEIALGRDDLGPPFREFLDRLARERGLGR